MIPGNVHHVILHGRRITVRHIAINIQPVCTFLQGHKAAEPGFARDKVLGAVFIGTERASCHLSLIVEGISQALDGSDAGIHGKVIGVKIVEIGFAIPGNDRLPAGNKRAKTCIVMLAVLFKQARQLFGRNAVRAKIVPEFAVLACGIAGQLLHAGQRGTILIVAPVAFLSDPAVLAVLLQVKRIREVNDGAEEMGAIVPFQIFAVVIRIQAVLDLILLLLGQRFKHMEVRINVIAQIAGDRTGKHVVFIPGRVVIGAQLQTAEHAKRIRGSRVDRLRLTDEIADHRQLVIHDLRRRQGKVLIGQTQIGGVDRKALRCGQRNGYRSQRTDTFRKLEQEVPRGPPLLIAAGQHVKQSRQFLRNGHLGHIYSKGVGGLRRSIGVDQIIGLLFLFIICIGDTAVPRQQAAAAGGIIEIKIGLITLIEIRRDLCGKLQCLIDRCCLGLNSGFLITVALSLGFLIGPRILLIDRCLEFRKLAGKHRTDRQRAQLAVGIRRKVEAGDRARFRVLKYKLRFSRIDLTALQLANRGQRDLQITKLHVAGIDLDQIAIISRFQRQLRRFSIDHIQALSGKLQIRRLNNMKGLGTQHAAVRSYQLDLHISQRFCGKHTACQRTDALVRHLQLSAFRQSDRTAGRGNASGFYRQIRANSQVIIVRRDDRMVKHIRRLGSRHYQQRRADRTLIAVRGPIDHRNGLSTFALCRKSSRAAAIQINCRNAAGNQHDLCDLNGTATRRKRFLTAIQNHQDDPAVVGDAHAGTGSAAGVVIIRGGNSKLTVLYQPHGSADCFLDLALVGVPLCAAADNRRSILQDAKEVLAAHAVIFDAFHDKSAGGGSVAHIIEVCVNAHHRAVIGDVMGRVRGIGMLFLRGIHLIRHTGHLPRGAVIIVIVCVNIHIIAGDVCRRDIINDLLIILRQSHLDLLRDAGSQRRYRTGEYFEVRICHLAACRLVQVIRKGIAAGLTQVGVYAVGNIGALQRADTLVGAIGIIDSLADILFRRYAVKAVFQEKLDPDRVRQILGIVVLHDGADGGAAVQLLQNIERVQIAVQVQNAKGVRVRRVIEEVLVVAGANLLSHFLHCAGHSAVGGQLHQIADIAGPAAQIRRILVLGVVRHVHCAEHMGKVYLIAVGQGKLVQAAQPSGAGGILSVLFCHIAGKRRLFRAAERCPCTGGILLHAAADIVDHKRHGLLGGMLQHIGVCVCFKCCQGGDKITVRGDRFHSGLRGFPVRLRRLVCRRQRFFILRLVLVLRFFLQRRGIFPVLSGRYICRRVCCVVLRQFRRENGNRK